MAKFLVVGAGIIGAAIAERLTAQGGEVIIVDGGPVAGGATGVSFGWINASFYADEAHFRLRYEGLKAWRRASERLGTGAVDWRGALSWEGDLEAQEESLRALGYEVTSLSRTQLAGVEPSLKHSPEAVLHFTLEGAGAPVQVTQAMLGRAVSSGAQLVLGQKVLSLLAGDGNVVGVETDAGLMMADHVVLAAGNGTSALLTPLGLDLPMLDRPGDMVVTAPAEATLKHVLVTPEREIRQDAGGRFWLPSSPGHQQVTDTPEAFHREEIAEGALNILTEVVDVARPRVERLMRARRPVPDDGLPVVGATGVEGLTVAVMHSGITLAALVGELVACEIAGQTSDLLKPYRLARFQEA